MYIHSDVQAINILSVVYVLFFFDLLRIVRVCACVRACVRINAVDSYVPHIIHS